MKKLWKEVLLFWLGMAFLAAWSNTLGPIARQKENADLTGTLFQTSWKGFSFAKNEGRGRLGSRAFCTGRPSASSWGSFPDWWCWGIFTRP